MQYIQNVEKMYLVKKSVIKKIKKIKKKNLTKNEKKQISFVPVLCENYYS